MKWYLLILGLLIGIFGSEAFASEKAKGDDPLRKSTLVRPPNFVEATSFPMPFNEIGNFNTPGNAAVSTGYYYVDSDDDVPAPWNPGTVFPQVVDTSIMAPLWTRILPGPRIVEKDFWDNNDNGMYFFRNPLEGNNFWTSPVDSTDNAIAGPIPIGIRGGFFFNGMRYDSFYVSTNGVIALTNRRYFYDSDGNRTIPPGATTCYDPNSMDWFIYNEGSLRDRQYQIDPATGGFARDANGNRIPMNGLNDPTRDDFGFRISVLGYDPYTIEGARTNAIMNNANNVANINTLIPANRRTALIAVFWGDMIMSQWHEDQEKIDDWGKAYFRRSLEGDSLIISYHNIQLKGNGLGTPAGAINISANIRPGEANYLAATAHVILSGRDSSVTIFYQRFGGITTTTYRGIFAWEVVRYNYAAGVRGFARHVNYNRPGGPVSPSSETYPYATEYSQHTHYFARYQDPNMLYPQAGTTVKFKQWRNILRVADIQYRVRKLDSEADLNFTETVTSAQVGDYELLAGEERLGAIQPYALIQNLSNEIQGPGGVNFIPQGINFRGRFRIISQITGEIVYNRLVPIDALCMGLDDTEAERVKCNGDPFVRVRLVKAIAKAGANYNPTIMPGDEYRGGGFNGVPPYYFVQVAFPPFQPNEFVANHIGRHRAFIIAEPRNARTGENLGGQWPFDDTTSVRLFVLNRIIPDNDDLLGVKWPFEDDGTQFHIDLETGVAIPSAYKWVNIEAEMMDGDQVSHYPLPPRGEVSAANNINRRLNSPTIKMNRLRIGGAAPDPKFAMQHDNTRNGDELRSFPIDMRGQFGSTLSLSVQRHQKTEDYPRGWSDDVLSAPEPRTIANGSNTQPFTVYAGTVGMSATNKFDELVVEFAKPSSDGLTEIMNISLYHPKNWRHHPHRRGNKDGAVETMSALTVFGAVGYMVGFLENDPDSTFAPPQAPNLFGLRANVYDDGIDWEYKKYFVPIPDTFIRWKAEGAKNFRFRIKVAAFDGSLKNPMIPSLFDDADDFFVDNIRITKPDEITDIEVNSVKIIWPYTLVPASQATQIPIRVNVSNNTRLDADAFSVKVNIYRVREQGGIKIQEPEPIYCRVVNVGNLRGNSTYEVAMPSWNARKSQLDAEQEYRLVANVLMDEQDMIPENDSNYTDVMIRIADVFAYDPPTDLPLNDVSTLVGPGGRGLNLWGSNWQGSNANPAINYQSDRAGANSISGTVASGSIAMKFELLNTDTLRGVRTVFGGMNQAPDYIQIRVLNSSGLTPGSEIMPGTNILRMRGVDDVTGALTIGNWVTYLFPQPVELKQGTYWVSISQLGQTGLELAASASRAGARITHHHTDPAGTWGLVGTTLLLDKNFRIRSLQGNLENNNMFAFENGAGGGGWVQFTPTVGRFAYPHFDYRGFNPETTDLTMTQGSWLPLIRPYFGPKAYGTAPNEYQWCPDDIPVELLSFDGSARETSIDLFWETASETNNSGFIVQRKLYEENDKEWSDIGYVQGKGNSVVINRYSFNDNEVVPHTTYQYRLTQMDFDGTQVCYTSDVVTLTYLGTDAVVLEQNTPNPFKDMTLIRFSIPSEMHVKLEVMDVFGNIVTVLADERMGAGVKSLTFNPVDANGNSISSGTYLYRLTADGKVLTGKMSLVR